MGRKKEFDGRTIKNRETVKSPEKKLAGEGGMTEQRQTKQSITDKATNEKIIDDLPDLKDKDVQDATTKIQSVFRGYQARKEKTIFGEFAKKTKKSKTGVTLKGVEDVPDLGAKDIQDASMKIQSAFRQHQAKK